MPDYKKHMLSSVLTILVVALLIASGPASAVNLDINGLMGSYKQGKDIKFKVEVEINHGDTDNELLPIQYANVKFTKKDSEWSQTCKIIDEETVEGCDFLEVKKIDVTGTNNYGYGPGFGYDNGTGYNLGYGYGYGYGTNGYKNAKVTYELVIESEDLDAGKYTAAADVYAGTTSPRTFSSEPTKFTIFEKNGGKEKEHKEDEEKKHHDIEDDDAGIGLEINTDSNSSGSVIIDYYDDNPVNDNRGRF